MNIDLYAKTYVVYTVQAGDQLSDFLKKAGMTKQEWLEDNFWKEGDENLKVGEKVVFEDRYWTCFKDEAMTNATALELTGKKAVDFNCSRFSLFWVLARKEGKTHTLTRDDLRWDEVRIALRLK